jgi:hypothetical protein
MAPVARQKRSRSQCTRTSGAARRARVNPHPVNPAQICLKFISGLLADLFLPVRFRSPVLRTHLLYCYRTGLSYNIFGMN